MATCEDERFHSPCFKKGDCVVESLSKNGRGFVVPSCGAKNDGAVRLVIAIEMAHSFDIPELPSRVSQQELKGRDNVSAKATHEAG